MTIQDQLDEARECIAAQERFIMKMKQQLTDALEENARLYVENKGLKKERNVA